MVTIYAIQMVNGVQASTLLCFTRATHDEAEAAFNAYLPDSAAQNIQMSETPVRSTDLPRSR